MRAHAAIALVVGSVVFTVPAQAGVIKVPADFATIQAAVSASGSGDEIVISKGTYAEEVLIFTKSDLTLRAKGKVTLVGPLTVAPIVPAAILTVAESTRVNLIGLRVAGPDDVFAIRVITCNECRLDGCRTTGGLSGLSIEDVNGLLVSDCTFKDAVNNGIFAFGTSATISGCTISNSGDDGINSTVNTISIEGNTVKGSHQSGIVIGSGTVSANITDNVIEDSALRAIDFLAATAVGTVAGNVVKGGSEGYHGLGLGVSVVDNKFTGCSDNALSLVGINTLSFGNRSNKCGGGLFVGQDCDSGIHSGNSFKKSKGNGVEIESGSTLNLFTGNTAKQSGGFDLLDASGGQNALVGNHFTTIGP